MKKLIWPGATLLTPVPPVIVTCGSMEKPNAITIGWTGILNSHPPKTYISIRPERYSYNIIKESREFIINMPTANLVKEIDWCGVRSGANEDKFKAMNFTPYAIEGFDCPAIEEIPLALTCKVTDIIPLGSHDMFMADIVNVVVNEDMLDEKGRLEIEKIGLMAYAHGQYFELGKKIGSFGFSVKKPEKKAKKQTKSSAQKHTVSKPYVKKKTAKK